MVWPETLSRTPWLINKLAGGPPFSRIHPSIHPSIHLTICFIYLCLYLSACLPACLPARLPVYRSFVSIFTRNNGTRNKVHLSIKYFIPGYQILHSIKYFIPCTCLLQTAASRSYPHPELSLQNQNDPSSPAPPRRCRLETPPHRKAPPAAPPSPGPPRARRAGAEAAPEGPKESCAPGGTAPLSSYLPRKFDLHRSLLPCFPDWLRILLATASSTLSRPPPAPHFLLASFTSIPKAVPSLPLISFREQTLATLPTVAPVPFFPYPTASNLL